jgi:hypothetical protein
MEVINRKVGIDLNIRSAFLKVETPTEVYVAWQRGSFTNQSDDYNRDEVN